MSDRPGFVDELAAQYATEQQGAESEGAAQPAPPPLPAGPMLLDLPEGAVAIDAGRLDVGWTPTAIGPGRKRWSSLVLIWLGLAGLGGSWIVIALVDFVIGQFHRAHALGWVTVALFATSGGLVAFGLGWETKAWRELRHVDALKEALARKDMPVGELRGEVLRWLGDVQGLRDAGGTVEAISRAGSSAEIAAIIETRVTVPMRRAALQAGTRAATEAAALVAVIPSPVAEGAITGIRSLLLVRQIARIYGIRPGLVATVMLLQRIAATVAAVAGTDLLARGVLETALHRLPYVKDVMASFPEASLTALRLYRLAAATSAACSPTEAPR